MTTHISMTMLRERWRSIIVTKVFAGSPSKRLATLPVDLKLARRYSTNKQWHSFTITRNLNRGASTRSSSISSLGTIRTRKSKIRIERKSDSNTPDMAGSYDKQGPLVAPQPDHTVRIAISGESIKTR